MGRVGAASWPCYPAAAAWGCWGTRARWWWVPGSTACRHEARCCCCPVLLLPGARHARMSRSRRRCACPLPAVPRCAAAGRGRGADAPHAAEPAAVQIWGAQGGAAWRGGCTALHCACHRAGRVPTRHVCGHLCAHTAAPHLSTQRGGWSKNTRLAWRRRRSSSSSCGAAKHVFLLQQPLQPRLLLPPGPPSTPHRPRTARAPRGYRTCSAWTTSARGTARPATSWWTWAASSSCSGCSWARPRSRGRQVGFGVGGGRPCRVGPDGVLGSLGMIIMMLRWAEGPATLGPRAAALYSSLDVACPPWPEP